MGREVKIPVARVLSIKVRRFMPGFYSFSADNDSASKRKRAAIGAATLFAKDSDQK